MSMLAVADIPNYWLWAFPLLLVGFATTFLWNGIISFFLYMLNRADRRHELSRARIEQMATEIIDTQFQSVIKEVLAFKESVNHLRNKVEDTEAQFDAVWDGEREMETKITKALHDLKVETMREFFSLVGTLATKSDVNFMRNELREELRK